MPLIAVLAYQEELTTARNHTWDGGSSGDGYTQYSIPDVSDGVKGGSLTCQSYSERLNTNIRRCARGRSIPYLEAANNRTLIWVEMHDALATMDDRTKFLSLDERLLDPHFTNLSVTYLAISDNAFRTAFQKFIDTEGRLKRTPTYTKDEIMNVTLKLRLAFAEINEAAERFLFSN
jgi:hypothetical protein